jgi:hypothetical protein
MDIIEFHEAVRGKGKMSTKAFPEDLISKLFAFLADPDLQVVTADSFVAWLNQIIDVPGADTHTDGVDTIAITSAGSNNGEETALNTHCQDSLERELVQLRASARQKAHEAAEVGDKPSS